MNPPLGWAQLVYDSFAGRLLLLLLLFPVQQFFPYTILLFFQPVDIPPDIGCLLLNEFSFLLLPDQGIFCFLIQRLLLFLKILKGPFQVNLRIACSVIIGGVIFKFRRKRLACLHLHLAHGYRVVITGRAKLSQQHLKIPVFYRELFSVILAVEFCLLRIFIKIPVNPEHLSSAFESQNS